MAGLTCQQAVRYNLFWLIKVSKSHADLYVQYKHQAKKLSKEKLCTVLQFVFQPLPNTTCPMTHILTSTLLSSPIYTDLHALNLLIETFQTLERLWHRPPGISQSTAFPECCFVDDIHQELFRILKALSNSASFDAIRYFANPIISLSASSPQACVRVASLSVMKRLIRSEERAFLSAFPVWVSKFSECLEDLEQNLVSEIEDFLEARKWYLPTCRFMVAD
jgi:hypothetical protein